MKTMNINFGQLDRIVQYETMLYCRSEDDINRNKGKLGRVHEDITTYAKETNCGISTAVLQHNLEKHHNISTERLVGEPEGVPLNRNYRSFGHVILTATLNGDKYIIDPTYNQIHSTYMGVSPDSVNVPPNELAAVFPADNQEDFISKFTESLYESSKNPEHIELPKITSLRNLGKHAIKNVVENIYTLEQYEPFDRYTEYAQNVIAVSEKLRS